jgi:predicted aspartyl protease
MGRFHIEFEIANNDDVVAARLGNIGAKEIRRMTIRGVVDSGAARFVLPKKAADALGLRVKRKVRVRYADRRGAVRNEVEGVRVTLLGRDDVFSAVVEPRRQDALIGAIVLETLDLLVDCTHQRLVPRDPDFIVSELE